MNSRMEEVWKPVPEYEGLYEVSNLGRARSLPRQVLICRGESSYTIKVKGKMLTLNKSKKGYFTVDLFKQVGGKTIHSGTGIHRLVAKAFIPNPEVKEQVNHKDGDKSNNTVGNLEWATCQENMDHAVATGLHVKGERNGPAKLTERRVRMMRKAYDNGAPISKLAELAGVCKQHCSRVVKRNKKLWKHLE